MGLDQTAIFSSNSTSREPDPDSVLVNTVREVLSPDGVAVIFNGAPKHRFGAQEFEELLAGDEELEHEVGNSTRHFCIKWGHQCVLSLHGPAQACLVLALRSPDGIAKPCSSGAASSVSAFNFNFFIVGFQFVVLLLHCRLSICGVAPSLSAFTRLFPHISSCSNFFVCSMFPLHCNICFRFSCNKRLSVELLSFHFLFSLN